MLKDALGETTWIQLEEIEAVVNFVAQKLIKNNDLYSLLFEDDDEKALITTLTRTVG